MIVITPALIDAVKLARTQCVTRVVQLSSCRVCGADQQRYEQAVAELDKFLTNLEPSDVQTLSA